MRLVLYKTARKGGFRSRYTEAMSKIDDVISGKARLLDVRSAGEWGSSHAEHAVHIPLEKLMEGAMGDLSPSDDIYIYCRSGARAGVAEAYLQEKGFRAENVGGLSDWLRAGGSLSSS